MMIPSLLLKKLYTLGSLKNTAAGVQLSIKNRLSDGELVGIASVAIDGNPVALEKLLLHLGDGSASRRLAGGRRASAPVSAAVRGHHSEPARRIWPRANTKSKSRSSPARSASCNSKWRTPFPTPCGRPCTCRAMNATTIPPEDHPSSGRRSSSS